MPPSLNPNLAVDDSALFNKAVDLLEQYASGRKLRTQNFAVAIAVLIHRDVPGRPKHSTAAVIHAPGRGEPISTGRLQEICDATYEKGNSFLQSSAQGPIYKPFTHSFKPRSPKANNWRNSYDLQAGLGCDAPYDAYFLRSPDFLAEDRFDCIYRNPKTGECNSPEGFPNQTRTCFNPTKKGIPPGPDTAALKCPKLLTRGKSSKGEVGYWFVEPTTAVLSDLLGDPTERVPLYPFLVALYGGSPHFQAWGSGANRERLERDVYLDPQAFSVLFDPTPANPFNQKILASVGIKVVAPLGITPKKIIKPKEDLSAPAPFEAGRDLKGFQRRAEQESDPARRLALLERASRAHARAFEALGSQLEAVGLSPTEQADGYDLHVECGGIGHLFEVKTWRPENLKSQVRTGLAQLYEYKWRNRNLLPAAVKLYIVLDREPPRNSDSWLWDYLVNDRDVTPCWIKKGHLRTFQKYQSRIAWLPKC